MAEISSELMFELLKRMHADIASMKLDVRDVKLEIQAMRGSMVSIQQDVHTIFGTLLQSADRLDRIEHRLDLRELAEAGAAFAHDR